MYVTCGDPATARRTVLCLDTADGHTVWRRDYPSRVYSQNRDNSFATATPAADGDGVVLTWTTPEAVILLALDSDGRDVWRRDLGPFVAKHGSGTSPVIVGGLVVLANDQEDMNRMLGGKGDQVHAVGKSFLIAVDRKTGETRWQVDRRTALAAYSTPCLYRAEGRPPELIFTSTAHGITAVDPATGAVNWEVDEIFLDRCAGSPVTAPGLVIAGYGYGTRGSLYVAVRPGSRRQGVQPSIVYRLKKPVPLVPTPLVKDGRLYFWYDDGRAACLDVATGEVIWRERIGGACYGSPVWVDGRLYGITRKGEVIVVAASDTFQRLARVPLGESSYATPAVAGGVMYLRTFSRLFSLGGTKP
jgi:outer membrane protein assembly factor BamB